MAALAEARSGRGRAILLGGEPGVGKSRLADEVASRAASIGMTVLWGRGWEDAGAPPYWLWVQALRSLIRSTSPDVLRRYLGGGAADVAQMLPEIGAMFPDVARPTDTDSESARFQLFDSTATFLRNAAQDRALVVVVDDLQAADTPSNLLLRFFASQVSDMAVLVLGTYRDIELTPDHPLTSEISEMARERVTRLISLKGLTSGDVRQYIAAATHVDPSEHLVAAVWRETNGNPLFVGEAVRLLTAEGQLSEVGDLASLRISVPAGIRAVIARRISPLRGQVGTVLELGAVLGPEFSIDVVRHVGDLSAEAALDAADEAVSGGLLLLVSGVAGRYRFSHDLVRETLYDSLPTARRIRLHQRIAETLEQLYETGGDAHLAELAFHYFEASRAGAVDSPDGATSTITQKAIDYARRAGNAAAVSLAYEEAARLYRLALAIIDLDRGARDKNRAEILLALGESELRVGDLGSARKAFLGLSNVARRLNEPVLFARAALGFGGRHQWARAGDDTQLVPLLEEALGRLGGLDDRLRVRLLTRLACAWRSVPERRADTTAFIEEAALIARRLDDPATLGYALAGRFWATWWPENPQDRVESVREMLALAEAMGDGERIAEAHLLRFLTLIEGGHIASSRREIDQLGRLLVQLRQPAQLLPGPTAAALLALVVGDFAAAEEFIELESGAPFRETPARDDVSAARMHRFLLRREQGRLGEEESTVRQSIREFPWYPLHRAALALLLAEVGRISEADELLQDLASNGFDQIYMDNEWLLGISLAAEVTARLGDVDLAQVLYDKILPFAGRHAVGHAEGSVGVVDRYLGLLATTLGRLDDAERHLTAAISLHDKMGARPWRAHVQHDLAGVLRRRAEAGDERRAAELDHAALDTARALGMVLADEITPPPAEPVARGQPQAATATVLGAAVLHREGDYWTIEFGADTFRLRDIKGLHHLALLLAAPGREIHSLELVGGGADVAAGRRAERADELQVDASADLGPALDPEAKAAYRGRLNDIRQELAEAERWNDTERAARLTEEAEALVHELAAAIGLGGRDRTMGSPAERARVSATRAIRTALERITEYSPALGGHLDATIRTGTFCSYTPDPRAPIDWRL